MKLDVSWLQQNGLYRCPHCNIEKTKNGIVSHIIFKHEKKRISNFCNYNNSGRKRSNQFIKAKELGLDNLVVSQETKNKISNKMSLYNKNNPWSEERKLNFSKVMQKAVENNPQSYSSKNVCGRTKMFNFIDSYSCKTKLNGRWELLVATFLNECNIKWTNIIQQGFKYEWNNKEHLYFPDFYLPELDLYIEVKGYERDRDRCKWKALNNLIIVKQKEIKIIKGLVSALAHNQLKP